MFGEYMPWYGLGWAGFHAAQDTFKPLGGTTGYFCTEPVQEIDWKDRGVIDALELTDDEGEAIIAKMQKHYKFMNRLLSLGAWDEFQVAEDYMLGLVTWWYGFNVAGFISLTPEDPAGVESDLGFDMRPPQLSRWIKGYMIRRYRRVAQSSR